jgi:hypothetical protein
MADANVVWAINYVFRGFLGPRSAHWTTTVPRAAGSRCVQRLFSIRSQQYSRQSHRLEGNARRTMHTAHFRPRGSGNP